MVLGRTHICENWREKKHVKAEDGLCPYKYFKRKIHFSTVGSSECSSPKQSRLSVHPPPPHAHNSTTSSSLSPLSTVTNTLSWWCTTRNPQYLCGFSFSPTLQQSSKSLQHHQCNSGQLTHFTQQQMWNDGVYPIPQTSLWLHIDIMISWYQHIWLMKAVLNHDPLKDGHSSPETTTGPSLVP